VFQHERPIVADLGNGHPRSPEILFIVQQRFA
jgi:hypothetical protein